MKQLKAIVLDVGGILTDSGVLKAHSTEMSGIS
jgi:hypothetical protein